MSNTKTERLLLNMYGILLEASRGELSVPRDQVVKLAAERMGGVISPEEDAVMTEAFFPYRTYLPFLSQTQAEEAADDVSIALNRKYYDDLPATIDDYGEY